MDNTWFSLIRRPSTNVEADFEERLNILLPHVHLNSLPYIDKSHSMTFPSITKRNTFTGQLLEDDDIKMPKKIQQYATIHPALPTTENGESTGQILPDKQILSRYPYVLP